MPPRDAAELGDLFMRVARQVRLHTAHALAPWELAPHHARALRVLGREGPLRAGALAERLRVAPRSATDVVDALESRGLVERGPDADDRRGVVITTTSSGERLLAQLHAARRVQLDELFGGLTDDEQAVLGGILTRLDEASR